MQHADNQHTHRTGRQRAGQATVAPVLDALIIGGGIAGLWLLNRLHRAHYQALLLEADTLGCQQTLGSQGIIHGGLKYTLSGALSGASEAIAGMPDRWRACLHGTGDVDLRGLAPLAEHACLFARGGSLGRLTAFFASRALRGRIDRLPEEDYPAALKPLDGVVYQLTDFVLDTRALLARLLEPVAHRACRHRVRPGELQDSEHGWCFRPAPGMPEIHARRLILAAGAGNEPLLRGLGHRVPAMQLRGLKQVLVRHPHLTPLFGHCLTAIRRPEPRLTITSHPDPLSPGRWLWYLGGALASDGAARSHSEQIQHARTELAQCIPWLDWSGAEFTCLDYDRAEPAQADGRRPDQAFVAETENMLVCWPTKLSLAPDLGDRVLHLLGPPAGRDPVPLPALPRAVPGDPPWSRG